MIQITLLVFALVHATLALFVYRAGRTNSVNGAFAAQSLVFAGWVLSIANLQTPDQIELRYGYAFAFASLIPVAFLFFSHCYPSTTIWLAPVSARIVFALGALFAMLSLTTNLIAYEPRITANQLSRKAGPLFPVFVAYFFASWGLGLGIFIKKWRSARGRARAQFHYLGAGVLAGLAGGISTNLIFPLITGRSTYSWMGPYFGLVYVGFVAHALIRHRLMELRLFIHRGLTVAIAIALSAIPTALLLAVFWPRLLLHLEAGELMLFLGAISVVTIITPLARDGAGRLLDRYVYRTHANYQRTVREASQILTRVLDLSTLLSFIRDTVMRVTAVEGVAVYLLRDGRFEKAAAETEPHAANFVALLHPPVAVVDAINSSQSPIVTDELTRKRESSAADIQPHLADAGWAVILPVCAEDTVIAVIAVGAKLSGDAFYRQDLDLLMTLANQASVAIKNAQLYAAVALANEYLENIAATIESGVIAIDARGRVTMFNRAAKFLTGLSAEETKGKPTAAIPACVAEPLEATMADGEARTQPEVELPCVTDGGPASRPVICTVSPVRDQGGAVLGAVAVFSDLTPLKELELERRRAERLAYFQALAAGIAHEIKNPLVAIKTFAQLLPRRQQDARFLGEFGRISTREIDRMQRLVDRLRTLSRPAGGPRHPVDVRLPLGEALELARPTLEEKGLRLIVGLGTEPCVILGNHPELEELFLNLVLNAHDATPAGGTVTVEVTSTETHATVTVMDSGPGIAPELLERVFEPFFTTKARGSGLGLAISAGIAQAHGAKLRVHNRPGGGAVFTVEFPLATVVPLVIS